MIAAPLWPLYGVNLGTLLRTCDAVGACLAVPRFGWVDEALARGNTLRSPSCIHRVGDPARWLADEKRAAYHAGAAIASNYLVTLYRAASRLFEDAGAPPEGLVPLMTRTIENGFQLTGPISRGDWSVVDAHLGALHDAHPELEPMYRVLAEATVP